MKYITGLGQMLIDIPLYIIKPTDTSNKLNQLLTFLFKEYPAYLREGGPTIRKILLLVPLIIYHILKPRDL